MVINWYIVLLVFIAVLLIINTYLVITGVIWVVNTLKLNKSTRSTSPPTSDVQLYLVTSNLETNNTFRGFIIAAKTPYEARQFNPDAMIYQENDDEWSMDGEWVRYPYNAAVTHIGTANLGTNVGEIMLTDYCLDTKTH